MRNILKNPLKMFFPKKMIGIDIGTSSVKMVEISRWGEGKTLENYGEVKSEYLYKEPLDNSQKGSYLLSSDIIAKTIRAILEEGHIKTKAAIFSVPDFSVFCTSFEIPKMTEKEIPDAIRYNSSQYITLPISEVTLDWRIIPNLPGESVFNSRSKSSCAGVSDNGSYGRPATVCLGSRGDGHNEGFGEKQ